LPADLAQEIQAKLTAEVS